MGAALGALIATLAGRGTIIYAAGIFLCGILAAIFRSWSVFYEKVIKVKADVAALLNFRSEIGAIVGW